MHAPGDGLEIFDVERKRPEMTVPADDVEWMMPVQIASDVPSRFHADFKLALLVVSHERVRRAEIAFGVGCALEELAILIHVTLGRLDVSTRALDNEHPLSHPVSPEESAR